MKKIETRLIQAGREKHFTRGAVNPVIQRASSIIFDSYSDQKRAIKECTKQSTLFYGRRGTLTHFSLQQTIIELEGGVGCTLYPCGTAAIASTILSFVSLNDHILVTETAYEATQKFCQSLRSKMNITTTWFHPLIGLDISTLIQEKTRIVLLESPGSITMEVHDIPSIVKAIRDTNPNIIIIIDNTWSSGLLLNALKMGVDISLYSGTKYILGHSDAMIGIAVANSRCWEQLREQSYLMGQIIDADTAYLALRGLRTLKIRLKQHGKSSLFIATWLSSHPAVAFINHPAFSSCKGHEFFIRDFSGTSGLFSFVLRKRLTHRQLENYLDNFKYFKIAYSWGGYESLILAKQPEEIAVLRPISGVNFTGTLIRLHIGLENCYDLIEDLENGFSRISEITL
ncbi:cystathionine beta-lyase [Candidatus Schneideria nysicola]|uniref:cystathionine beta-lyase n=1 Tax=Candidatus Schneideria nysicola TaxID=1081631 RepID=UPI001CAA6F0E|nr:cystathionine beta-lyase [Candidatus Schneideria nysicola]UAJ66176.1 cystathionine beta-lyase [Candidatus Schneideria nysicola]